MTRPLFATDAVRPARRGIHRILHGLEEDPTITYSDKASRTVQTGDRFVSVGPRIKNRSVQDSKIEICPSGCFSSLSAEPLGCGPESWEAREV